jgi:hypothetical protein
VRRRRKPLRNIDRTSVRWIVGSMVFGMVVAAATIPTELSPTVIGLGGLAVVLVIILASGRREHGGVGID